MIAFDAMVRRGTFAAHYRGKLEPLAVITGPSGSGKTTLLDLIAGLVSNRGSCLIDTVELHRLPPHRRGIGYAFQDDRLFPHLNVEENLSFANASDRAAAIIDALELGPLLKKKPRDLSGGEKRRVGIGRAIIAAERLLLLDEPLSPLDERLRARVSDLILETAKKLPTIAVSHEPLGTSRVEIASLLV